MVTYYVVNETERTKFEKKYHVPYGYYAVPFFNTEEGSVGYVEKSSQREHLIVEKWDSGSCEVIYRGTWYEVGDDE